MDLNALAQTYKTLVAAHPVGAQLLSAFIGAAGWHKALAWLETSGIDKIDSYFAAKQKFAAKRLGFSDAQIAEIEQGEAASLERAAQDAKARADEDARAAIPPVPPATPVV